MELSQQTVHWIPLGLSAADSPAKFGESFHMLYGLCLHYDSWKKNNFFTYIHWSASDL